MSLCGSCGVSVTWARRSDGSTRMHPPLEYAGRRYVITKDEVVRETDTFVRHRCDPERVAELAEYRELAKLRREEMEATRVRLTEIALRRDCPRCGSTAGTPCANLTARRQRNETAWTRWPHQARVPEAERVELAGPVERKDGKGEVADGG